MSLVLWHDGVLVADEGSWLDGIRRRTRKLRVSHGGAVATAFVGHVVRGKALADYIARQPLHLLADGDPDTLRFDSDTEDMSAFVLVKSGDRLVGYEYDAGGVPAEFDISQTYAIGNIAAIAASLALVKIAGYTPARALQEMLDSTLYDAIDFGVQSWAP